MGALSPDIPDPLVCPIAAEAGVQPRRSIDCSAAALGAVNLPKAPACLDEDTAYVGLDASPYNKAVWHPSTHWQQQKQPAPAKAADPQTARLQQQLASACQNRDAKQLQQIITSSQRKDSIQQLLADPLDAATGNTALHAVLQQGGHTPNTKRSWLPSCFGGGGASVPPGSSEGRTLSATAAATAQYSMVQSLLASGAAPNARNAGGDTPLMLAVQQLTAACNSSSSMGLVMPALRVLVLLCKHVLCDANMKDAQGRTALALLLQGYQQQQQQPAADKAAAATQASSSPAQPPSAPPPPNSPALAAVQLKAVQMLLHCGSDCNAADRAGMTPLMFAAAQPSISKELLQLLLEKGANARQLDNNRRSALAHAVLAHNLVLLPALGHSAPPAQPQAGQCPGCGHVCSSIKKSPGADKQEAAVGAAASQGPTAADAEAEAATADVLAANIDSGSNSSSGGTNPDLHAQVHGCTVCACSGSTSATHSSSSNSATHSTTLPAAPAPNPRHGMVVRALCSYGALDLHPQSINTRFPGVNGFTQLHIAMRRGDVQAAAMLLASGGDPNATDSYGNSPLMYWPVVPSEPAELVEELVGKLLSHGADPNIPNADGWHALDSCCTLNKLGKVVVNNQHVPVHALLVGWGATNSAAFKAQYRNPPQLLCMRTDSANSFIRNSKGFGSIRAVSMRDLESQVAALRVDTSQ